MTQYTGYRPAVCDPHNLARHCRCRNRSVPIPGRWTGRNRLNHHHLSRRPCTCLHLPARFPPHVPVCHQTKFAGKIRLPSLEQRSNTSARLTGRLSHHRRTERHAGRAECQPGQAQTDCLILRRPEPRYSPSHSPQQRPCRHTRLGPYSRQSGSAVSMG